MKTEISSLSDVKLISEVKRIASQERSLKVELLNYLCEVERRRLFALYGYPSLYSFCMKFLGYTEAETQRRVEAMRAMIEVPEIEEKIQNGALSLTAVAQAQSYFKSQEKIKKPVTTEVKREVLLSLENKSTRECERELIKLSGDIPLPKEKIRPISETHSQSTMNLPNTVLEKLERIKSLLSHKNPKMTQAELLNEMADIVLDKINPVRKKRRTVSVARMVNPKTITAEAKRQVIKRDQGKCTYISPITKQECNSIFLIEIDHIKPRALGGESTPENLRLLCKAHNQLEAIEIFGLKKMNGHINRAISKGDLP